MLLKTYGRVALIGLIQQDIAIPYSLAGLGNPTIKGQYMYEREDIRGIIKLVETGVLKLGQRTGHVVLKEYQLENWETAFKHRFESQGAGKTVLLAP